MISYYDYQIIENEHLYGPGKRLLIFLQGCSLHCKGCVNKHLWDFKCEKMLSKEDILRICEIEKVDGITLHGGEPLDQAKDLLEVVKTLKEKKYTVILFTGYNKKEIKSYALAVWKLADIVISGRFIFSKQNFYLQFRGSTNQRVITHKGKYKNYKVKDGKTVSILSIDRSGNLNIKGFYSNDIKEITHFK